MDRGRKRGQNGGKKVEKQKRNEVKGSKSELVELRKLEVDWIGVGVNVLYHLVECYY